MFQKFRFSTRAHLLALALAIITPLLIFAAILLFQYAHYERERTEQLAQQLAINIGGIVDAEIEQALALLRGLAASAALSSRNYDQFYEEARRALGREDSVIIRPATSRGSNSSTRLFLRVAESRAGPFRCPRKSLQLIRPETLLFQTSIVLRGMARCATRSACRSCETARPSCCLA